MARALSLWVHNVPGGHNRKKSDHCMFTRAKTVGHTFILVCVDDIIVASKSMILSPDVKKAPEATFHMEDTGKLHWFLGLRIRREEGKVTVDQERYKEAMLGRFQMDQCKPSRTPAELNLKLQTAQIEDEEVDQSIYSGLIGSILYLAEQTRPDIKCRSQHSVQTHECTYQSTLAMQKTTSEISLRFKGLKFTYTNKLVMI